MAMTQAARKIPRLRKIMAVWFPLAGRTGGATPPDLAPPQAVGTANPQIVTRRGPLTVEQSKAILQRLSADAGDAGLLQRHTAYEEAISESPLIAGNRTRLLRD